MTLPEPIRAAVVAPSFDARVAAKLNEWSNRSKEFSDYLAAYSTKIGAKLRGAKTEEDQRDIGTELFVAFVLLQAGLDVVPEPKGGGPDLGVHYQAFDALVEVKRFRVPKETREWESLSAHLREVVEPLVPSDLDVHLIIMANYSNYRYHRHPGLKPPLETFEAALPQIERYVLSKLSSPPSQPMHATVPGLPTDFASLRLRPCGTGRFEVCYPATYLREADRLLSAISDKSKQAVSGTPNVVVFWMKNITETFDDFEIAVSKRRQLLNADAGDFCARHGFTDLAECEACWARCSAFAVSDSERDHPTLWLNPEALTPLPPPLAKAVSDALECRF